MIDLFEDADQEWLDEALVPFLTVENFKTLLNVVMFYGHPDTYFATTTIADRPAGDFADDFSECTVLEGDEEVPVGIRPGKLARETLSRMFPDA